MIKRDGSGRASHLAGWVAGALCIMAAAPASAQDATSTNLSGLDVAAMIQPADWIYKPRSFAFFNFLPPKIVRTGIKGDVVLKCRVLPDASVKDCSVLSESSTGVLGEAAIKASALFKIRPRSVSGTLSDNAWVRIPISYNLGRMRQVGEPPDEP